jgi:hypothetical protein
MLHATTPNGCGLCIGAASCGIGAAAWLCGSRERTVALSSQREMMLLSAVTSAVEGVACACVGKRGWWGRCCMGEAAHVSREVVVQHQHLPHLLHGGCAVHGCLEAAVSHQVRQSAQMRDFRVREQHQVHG